MNRSITTRLAKLEERFCPKGRRSFAMNFILHIIKAHHGAEGGVESPEERDERPFPLMLILKAMGEPSPERDAAYDELIHMGVKPLGPPID